MSPNGYMAGGSFYPRVIAYNPSLVPPERVPRKWDDCLHPYWKGKFAMDVRPAALVSLYPAWGEQRILQFAKRIKEQNPTWQRGVTKALTMIAAGEFAMVCGTSYASVDSVLRNDPAAKLKIAWPDEVPVSLNESLGIMKGAKSPNAALLLTGWPPPKHKRVMTRSAGARLFSRAPTRGRISKRRKRSRSSPAGMRGSTHRG